MGSVQRLRAPAWSRLAAPQPSSRPQREGTGNLVDPDESDLREAEAKKRSRTKVRIASLPTLPVESIAGRIVLLPAPESDQGTGEPFGFAHGSQATAGNASPHLVTMYGALYSDARPRTRGASGKSMGPEEEARQIIDAKLEAAGWVVQDMADLDLTAGAGIAVREFPLEAGHGKADYLLYADGKAIGVVEAKPEGHTLTGVETQSAKYAEGLPDGLPPLPPAAAVRLRVHGRRDAVHQRPGPRPPQPRGLHLPPPRRTDPAGQPSTRQLRGRPPRLCRRSTPTASGPLQIEAIQQPGSSLAPTAPASLIQMATGAARPSRPPASSTGSSSSPAPSGSFPGGPQQPRQADAQRVPAVRQPLHRLQVHRGVTTSSTFAATRIDPASQGLHHHDPAALLDAQGRGGIRRGERRGLAVRDRASRWSRSRCRSSTTRSIPIETFDFIVIDECHRSIYNVWRQVLGILRRLHHRPDRHAHRPDHRLLQRQPRPGIHATNRPSPTA